MNAALVALVTDLCRDPDVMNVVTELTLKVMDTPEVTSATTALLAQSTQTALDDNNVSMARTSPRHPSRTATKITTNL